MPIVEHAFDEVNAGQAACAGFVKPVSTTAPAASPPRTPSPPAIAPFSGGDTTGRRAGARRRRDRGTRRLVCEKLAYVKG
jgi:hypothetical protein